MEKPPVSCSRWPLHHLPLPAPQDFLKTVDMQFLDHMRRGASLNYADLAPNPVPASLTDALQLMAVVAPEVEKYEKGVRLLQVRRSCRAILTSCCRPSSCALGALWEPLDRTHLRCVFRGNWNAFVASMVKTS